MPRTVTVTLSDGQQVVYQNAPDDLTPEQVQQRVAQEHPGAGIKEIDGGRGETGFWAGVKRHAADIPRGLTHAVAGMLQGGMNLGAAEGGISDNVTPQVFSEGAEKLMPTPVDASAADKYARIGLEGVGGALSGGPKQLLVHPKVTVAAGAGAGVGSQIAADTLGDNPLTRLFGALLGGGAAGAGVGRIAAARAQTQDIISQAFGRVDEGMLKKAMLFQQQAEAKGLPMDIAQALEAVGAPNSDVTVLRNIVANSRQGTKLKGQLESQPSQLELASEGRVQQMPGRNYGLEQSSNNLGEAATEAVQAAKKRGTKLWESTYNKELEAAAAPKKQEVLDAVKALTTARGNRMAAEKTLQDHIDAVRAERIGAPAYLGEPAPNPAIAGKVDAAKAAEGAAQANLTGARQGLAAVRQVDPKVVMEQIARLQALAAKVENTPKAAMLRDLAGSMLNKDGTPITDASNLNEVLKAAVNKTKTVNLNTPGITRGESKYLESQVAETRGNFGEAFAPFREANKMFGRYQEAVVEPLRQGPVGQLAGPTGYDPVRQVPISRVVTLFERGSDPTATSSPVRTAARQLAKAGRGDDFLDAAKAYWSAKVQKSFDANPSNGPATNADAAKRLYDGLFSDKMRMQTAKDTVASVAELSGTNPVEAVRGLQNYAMIVKGMTNRPATLEGLREKGVFQVGGQNYGSDILRVFGFLPFNTAARRLEDRVLGNTFRDLDNLMTTPEGVAKLAELAKAPVMSKKAITIFSTIGAEMGTQPPQQQ